MTTNMDNTRGHIYALIAEIGEAEKITKLKLSQLSREILDYVMGSKDIEAVNRLLEVLTPMNKRTAILFFKAMLPWQAELNNDKAFVRFGKMVKSKKLIAKSEAAIIDFLSDKSNDIWSWAEINVEVEKKKKDFAGMIDKAIKGAIAGDEKTDTPPLSRKDIIAAIFKAGLTVEEMMDAITEPEEAPVDNRNVDVDIPVVAKAA